jgi:hypothetical protein
MSKSHYFVSFLNKSEHHKKHWKSSYPYYSCSQRTGQIKQYFQHVFTKQQTSNQEANFTKGQGVSVTCKQILSVTYSRKHSRTNSWKTLSNKTWILYALFKTIIYGPCLRSQFNITMFEKSTTFQSSVEEDATENRLCWAHHRATLKP